MKTKQQLESDHTQVEECGGLTRQWDVQLVLECSEHLQREGLTFLPNINELSDFFLQYKK